MGKKLHKAFEESHTFWAQFLTIPDEGMLACNKTRVASKLEMEIISFML